MFGLPTPKSGMQMMVEQVIANLGIPAEAMEALKKNATSENVNKLFNMVIATHNKMIAIDKKLDFIISCMRVEETSDDNRPSDLGSTSGGNDSGS